MTSLGYHTLESTWIVLYIHAITYIIMILYYIHFLIVCFLMSLQFKKKKRSANLRKNDDFSSEEEVKIVSMESKKMKTVIHNTSRYI